jgi:hypothetical protein
MKFIARIEGSNLNMSHVFIISFILYHLTHCTGPDPASLTSLRLKKEDAVLGAEVFIKSSNA